MMMFLLTLVTAIAISAVAAYFSIVGLVAIFASAPIAIAIMGTVLEVAKLVTASWIYRNWTIAPKFLKFYFSLAVVILSLITSMGIFGYLSKAHIEHTTTAGPAVIQLKILEQREQILKQRINFLLSQEGKTTDVNNRLGRELNTTQNELKKVLDEKIPLLQEVNKLDAKIGPLRYITEFIYGEADETLISKAVRWVIITFIFVFDPLAILLLIAANISLKQVNNKEEWLQATKLSFKNKSNKKSSWDKVFSEMPPDDPSKVKIDRSKIHEIPREILEKVFKK